MVTLPFANRGDAGRQLAGALQAYRGSRPLVLAIPRGAVPIARQVADALGGDLDLVLVKKIGAPGNPEVAIGSVDEQGHVQTSEYAHWLGVDPRFVREEAARQHAALQARRVLYRGHAPAVPATGRVVIVIDDGLATGATMAAALRSVRQQQPARLVCAVPVAAPDALAQVERLADDVVCLATPSRFGAVGRYYLDFSEVDDAKVAAALAPAAVAASRVAPAPAHGNSTYALRIPAGARVLDADLVVPQRAGALVVFVHGSGSSRHSPRNRSVAHELNRKGIATLLFDLLAPDEDTRSARFDIRLLTSRLRAVVDWVQAQPPLREMRLGLFGASTGAAAALLAAAGDARVQAVVSRGGRPDLAGHRALAQVHAPTLLIVGGADTEVIELNREAAAAMHGAARLVLVPGASHLFEEPGALEAVSALAAEFFARQLVDPGPPRAQARR